MKIIKGQRLHIKDTRKGQYNAIATENFDTETWEFYPVVLAEGEFVNGLSFAMYWQAGEKIPCRRGHCTVEVTK